jgi:hypothetical protein
MAGVVETSQQRNESNDTVSSTRGNYAEYEGWDAEGEEEKSLSPESHLTRQARCGNHLETEFEAFKPNDNYHTLDLQV